MFEVYHLLKQLLCSSLLKVQSLSFFDKSMGGERIPHQDGIFMIGS